MKLVTIKDDDKGTRHISDRRIIYGLCKGDTAIIAFNGREKVEESNRVKTLFVDTTGDIFEDAEGIAAATLNCVHLTGFEDQLGYTVAINGDMIDEVIDITGGIRIYLKNPSIKPDYISVSETRTELSSRLEAKRQIEITQA